MNIHIAKTEADIRLCFPAMYELRPHLTEERFIAQVGRQEKFNGYTLAFIEPKEAGQSAPAVAGFRVAEYLAWGKILYVDDLSTMSSQRKRGYAQTLMRWLEAKAVEIQCAQLHLDSGVQRHDAHRLYLKNKLIISSHHFSKEVG